MKLDKVLLVVALLIAVPADGKWRATTGGPATPVAASRLSVVPATGWNRWSKKPIKKGELWSLDGPLLNALEFSGGIAAGEPLAKERNKRREPLPKFASDMKASDIADLLERTIRNTEAVTDFTIDAVEPATFAGRDGFRLAYRYTSDELVRRAEARGAVVEGKLYLIRFTAPALYYFDAGLPEAQAVMNSAKIG